MLEQSNKCELKTTTLKVFEEYYNIKWSWPINKYAINQAKCYLNFDQYWFDTKNTDEENFRSLVYCTKRLFHLKQLKGRKTPQAADFFAYFARLKKEEVHLALSLILTGQLQSWTDIYSVINLLSSICSHTVLITMAPKHLCRHAQSKAVAFYSINSSSSTSPIHYCVGLYSR